MNWRNRWTFWALVTFVLLLISIPSVEWVTALRDYAAVAGDWTPSPLKPTQTTFTPREGRREPAEIPELVPFEFKHRAPKAKSVELVGDFNAWKPGLFKMLRRGDGAWTLVVPLRPGRHKYLFLEDGRSVADPSADAADGPQGRRVSARTVR